MSWYDRLEGFMKGIKRVQGICLLLILIMVFTACGKKDSMKSEMAPTFGATNTDEASGTDSGDGSISYGDKQDSDAKGSEDGASTDDNKTGSDVKTTKLGTTQSNDKIIYKYNLELETKDFDQFLEDTNKNIQTLGGYIENSQVGGKSYNEDNVTRTGNIVARIPSNQASRFLDYIKKAANITNSEQSSENVSLQYVDAQSRLDTLKIEQDRLSDILKNTKDLDSIVTLESRLTDIRYEIEKYQSQLRVFDNQVEYSYVTLSIQEVQHISKVVEKKPTFFSRISNGLSENLRDVGNGFQSFLVWLIVSLPYFLIWGVIILAITLIVRAIVRKYSKKPVGVQGNSGPVNPNSQYNNSRPANQPLPQHPQTQQPQRPQPPQPTQQPQNPVAPNANNSNPTNPNQNNQ